MSAVLVAQMMQSRTAGTRSDLRSKLSGNERVEEAAEQPAVSEEAQGVGAERGARERRIHETALRCPDTRVRRSVHQAGTASSTNRFAKSRS